MSEFFSQEHMDQLKQLIASSQSRTRIITITSGKGGVGKSNFALNFAITLANLKDTQQFVQPKRVVLLDADLGLANINVLLGIIPKANLYHVLKGQKTLQEIIFPTNYGIDLIAGASGLTQLANLTEQERFLLVKSILELNYADYLIIDTAAGVSASVTQFAGIADDTIIVTNPEPTSITDAYGIIKSISLEHGDRMPKLKLIINRAQSQREAEKVASKVIAISNQFLNVQITPLGYIPETPLIPNAVRKQIPFCILYPNTPPVQSLEQITRKLLNLAPKEINTGNGWKKFLDYLIGN